MRKKSLFGQIVVVLIMIGVAVSVLYPFLWIIVSTFKFETYSSILRACLLPAIQP